VLSAEPEARYSPSGDHATEITTKECPESAFIRVPLFASHTLIVLSAELEAM
jgi:hypothetical protein